jgi:hypothetical protein
MGNPTGQFKLSRTSSYANPQGEAIHNGYAGLLRTSQRVGGQAA